MRAAPRIEISAPVAARADYLQVAYADMVADPERLADALAPLRRHRGGAVVDGWHAPLKQGDFLGLSEALIRDHYDPSYARSRALREPRVLARIATQSLDAAAREELADRIAAALDAR